MPRDPKKRKTVTRDRELEVDESRLIWLQREIDCWGITDPTNQFMIWHAELAQSINERKIIKLITGSLPE